QEVVDFLPEASAGDVARCAGRGGLVARDVEGDMRALPLRFDGSVEPAAFVVGGAPHDDRAFIQVVAVVAINHLDAMIPPDFWQGDFDATDEHFVSAGPRPSPAFIVNPA